MLLGTKKQKISLIICYVLLFLLVVPEAIYNLAITKELDTYFTAVFLGYLILTVGFILLGRVSRTYTSAIAVCISIIKNIAVFILTMTIILFGIIETRSYIFTFYDFYKRVVLQTILIVTMIFEIIPTIKVTKNNANI